MSKFMFMLIITSLDSLILLILFISYLLIIEYIYFITTSLENRTELHMLTNICIYMHSLVFSGLGWANQSKTKISL